MELLLHPASTRRLVADDKQHEADEQTCLWIRVQFIEEERSTKREPRGGLSIWTQRQLL